MTAKAENKPLRVLAAASLGGHWVQLLRIARGLHGRGCEVDYLSTHHKCAAMIPAGSRFYRVVDFSRSDAYRIFQAFWQAWRALRRSRPELVVTTGAAPGLVVLLAARLMGVRAVWVDSIANVERLSMCGRVASHVASACYTQWPELACGRVKYAGNVLGDNSHAAAGPDMSNMTETEKK